MRSGAWRYGRLAAIGAVVGLGWWLSPGLPAAVCAPDDYPCRYGMEWNLLLLVWPALPVVSWLAAWFALRRLGVAKPGVTAATCVGVTLLLALVTAGGGALPAVAFGPGVGAVAFLIGGLLSA
ncbi:hypothetical protein ACIQMJ_02460 [Actinosynnema sp. NPDC091369]